MMKNCFLLLKTFLVVGLWLITNLVHGQNTVTGKVTSADNNEGLPGANIIIKGTSTGTVTDVEGNYQIDVPANDAVLVFTSVGYLAEEIPVNSQSVIDVTMAPDITSLEEIVVVGYGTQKKSDVTGAVASVPQERLQQVPNTNFAQAIQGAIPGVRINTNSGGAEQNDVSIMIRGRNSIKASNSPLIVLDGIPYSGSVSEINPTDIESIEVLKDASAAAIYGSRGANGVILITTKRGDSGKPTISYDGFYGIQKIAKLPPILSGSEFYDFKMEREPDAMTNSEEAIYQNGNWTDWVDLTTQTGHRTQHTLSVSGATDNLNYYISGTYLNVEGVAVNDLFDRYSTRINVETNITDWLTFGTNTQLSLTDRGGISANFGSDWSTFYMNPLTSAYDENGDLTIYPWPEEVYFGNPLEPTLATTNDKSYKVFTNNYLQVDLPFVPGLSYKLNTGVEYTNRENNSYYGRDTKQGFERQGVAETRNRIYNDYVVENILSYNREFGNHNIFLTGLYSFQSNQYRDNQLDSRGFPNDVLTWYQAELGSLVNPSSSYSKQNLISQMFRANYTYDSRYLITLTGRNDGFSGFGEQRKWGFFPSVAVGWNLHNESFMAAVPWMSTLKLRASFGENGNQAVGAYETLARLSEESYLNGSVTAPGYIPSKLGNDNLGWETTTTLNIGADFGILDDRLQGSLEYFNADTEDLLLDRQISSVHGISTITQNIGKTNNQGVELSLTSFNVRNTDLKWTTNGNITYLKNEIIALYGTGEDDILNGWFINEPIRVNYGLVFDGIYQEGEDIANSAQPDAQPGFAKIKDLNDDGAIDDQDRAIQGNRDPNVIWGLNNTLTWKNFTLNVFIHGVHGVTRDNNLLQDDVWGEVRRNTIKKNWWTPQNPTNAYWSNHIDANLRNVNIYQNASFVRLKDVSLAYNLPGSVLDNLGVQRLKLYFTARNLVTLTKWDGLDPELGSQRAIPLQREYLIGLNLSF